MFYQFRARVEKALAMVMDSQMAFRPGAANQLLPVQQNTLWGICQERWSLPYDGPRPYKALKVNTIILNLICYSPGSQCSESAQVEYMLSSLTPCSGIYPQGLPDVEWVTVVYSEDNHSVTRVEAILDQWLIQETLKLFYHHSLFYLHSYLPMLSFEIMLKFSLKDSKVLFTSFYFMLSQFLLTVFL